MDSSCKVLCIIFHGHGIPQNGALGCQSHHEMLDNGNKGRRAEMLQIFKSYLQDHYPDWSEDALTYNKWKHTATER